MKDIDTKLLEEAMKNIYEEMGQYQIKIQLLDNGMELASQTVDTSGDEYTWDLYKHMVTLLRNEEEE